jgi:hypothetical protein
MSSCNTFARWRVPSNASMATPIDDRILFWTTIDLETKLLDFQNYYNGHRTHAGAERTPAGSEP